MFNKELLGKIFRSISLSFELSTAIDLVKSFEIEEKYWLHFSKILFGQEIFLRNVEIKPDFFLQPKY